MMKSSTRSNYNKNFSINLPGNIFYKIKSVFNIFTFEQLSLTDIDLDNTNNFVF